MRGSALRTCIARAVDRLHHNTALRIGHCDSSESSVLAGADETFARNPRKFFYCQNSRLRVRATRFPAARVRRDDVARALRVENVNQENSCAAGVSCNIDKCRCRSLLHFLLRVRTRCGACDHRASRALTLRRQHFLKRDAVFFDVLVYSGCSASRFPSARSELSHLTYIRRATWPRKLRRQRRRRAQ